MEWMKVRETVEEHSVEEIQGLGLVGVRWKRMMVSQDNSHRGILDNNKPLYHP